MADRAQKRIRGSLRGLLRTSACGLSLICAVLATQAVAQDAPQNPDDAPLVYFDIGTGLRYEADDPGETEISLDTNLGAGVYLATSSQRLSFESEILLQVQEDEAAFTDPRAALSYAIFNRGTEISVELSYSEVELEDTVLDDTFDADDLIQDGGRREQIDAAVGLVTGRDARFGTQTVLSYRSDVYSDGATDDDETLISLSSGLRFNIDPRIVLRTDGFLSRNEVDDADNTVETIHAYGLSADILLDRAWTANLGLGFRERVTETDTTRTVVDGVEGSFLLTRELPNGVLSFSATREIAATGTEDILRIQRALTLANGAEVDVSLGAVIFEDADPIAIYSAAYANEFRRGSRISLSFDRTGGVSTDDENIIRTRVNAGFGQDLTRVSSLSLDASLLQVEDASALGTDTSRFDLTLGYRHALTEDWNLAALASHGILMEDGVDDERTTVFSIGIERRFSFRP